MILQLENISMSFGARKLFSQVNVRLNKGESLALVGPNGAGKTTLLNIIAGIIKPESGTVKCPNMVSVGYVQQEGIEGGEVSVLQELINSQYKVVEAEKHLELLESSLGSNPTLEQLEAVGKARDVYENMDGYTLESRIRSVLFGLGFTEDDLNESCAHFSGGWQMRIALAKLLVGRPDLLLLDEPTNHLDLESTMWLESFLRSYSGTIILVSHDRSFMDAVVRRVAEIDNGVVNLYQGNYSSYVKQREDTLERLRKKRSRQIQEMKRLEDFVERFRYKATKARQAQEREKRLEKLKEELVVLPESRKKVHFSFPQPERTGQEVAKTLDVCKSFGSHKVYEGLNFTLYRGDKVALVGPNGSGKSTLLKMISGIIKPDAGRIKYGVHVSKSYYAQHAYEQLNKSNTVFSELDEVAPAWTEGQVRSLLGAFLFRGDDIEKPISVLSGGEKSRLSLAKMLVKPASLLCLDEPTNHLDIPSCDILEQALQSFSGSIMFITHDKHLLRNVATRILEISPLGVREYNGNYDYYLQKSAQINNNLEKNLTQAGQAGLSGQADHLGKIVPKKMRKNASPFNGLQNNKTKERVSCAQGRKIEEGVTLDSQSGDSNVHDCQDEERNGTDFLRKESCAEDHDNKLSSLVSSSQKQDTIVTSSRGSAPKSKEQKRREAEARNKIYAASKKLKLRLEKLDKQIESDSARIQELLELMADPEFYIKEEGRSDAIAEHAMLKKRLEEAEEKWLELSEKLELEIKTAKSR